MARKLLWLLIALAGAAPSGVVALGIGQIEVRSGLNQPLNARIPLLLSPEERDYLVRLNAELAPAQAFQQAGIERSSALADLKFSIQADEAGNGYVQLTSKRPIREPMLDFLVEVSWPKGRLVREFAVLLEPAAAPARPAAVALRPALKPSAAEPRAAAPPPVAHRGTASYGPIARGETLWSIAERSRPDPSISRRQMMQALFEANPRAFRRSSLSGLMAGVTLRIPSAQEIDPGRFSEQTSRQLAERPVIAAAPPPASAPAARPPKPAAAPDQVRLLPPEPDEERRPPATTAAARPAAALAAPFRITVEGEHPKLRLAGMDDLRSRMSTLSRVETARGISEEAPANGAAVEAPPEREPQTSPAGAGAATGFQEILPETVAPPEAASGAPVPAAGTAEPPRPEPEPPPAVAAPVTPPAQPAAPPAPVAAEPAALSPPQEPGFWEGILEPLWADPLKLALLGFIVLLLIALLVFLLRRFRTSPEHERPAFETVIPSQMPLEETAIIVPPAERSLSEPISRRSRAVTTMAAPLERANSLIAAGNYREAGDTIRSALAQNPDSAPLRARLLDVYYATGNKEGFLKEAQALHDKLGNETDPVWIHTAELGRELDPNHPLFRSKAEVSRAPVIELSKAGGKARAADPLDILDFDLEHRTGRSETPSARTGSESAATVDELDWRLPAAEPSTVTSTLPPEQAAQRDDVGFQFKDLNFDFDQVAASEKKPGVTDEPSSAPVPENTDFLIPEAAATAAPAKRDAQPAFGLGDLDFDLDSLSGRPAVAEHSAPSTEDYVETKLDLAMAYLDMGDPVGARSLLEEVLQEGNATQQQRAQEFMAKLG